MDLAELARLYTPSLIRESACYLSDFLLLDFFALSTLASCTSHTEEEITKWRRYARSSLCWNPRFLRSFEVGQKRVALDDKRIAALV